MRRFKNLVIGGIQSKVYKDFKKRTGCGYGPDLRRADGSVFRAGGVPVDRVRLHTGRRGTVVRTG